VIMITAYGTLDNAVRAMQKGATNFIQKRGTMKTSGRRARGRGPAGVRKEENEQLKRAFKQRYNFETHRGQERIHAQDF